MSISSERFESMVGFKVSETASTLFEENFWDYIKGYMPFGIMEHIFSAKELAFQISGLILHGLIVTGYRAKNGIQRAIVTFKRVVGDAKFVFKREKSPDFLSDSQCTLATRTLSDIILPVLNIAATEPISIFAENRQSMEAFFDCLDARKSELEFLATLLKRFINSIDGKTKAGPIVHKDEMLNISHNLRSLP